MKIYYKIYQLINNGRGATLHEVSWAIYPFDSEEDALFVLNRESDRRSEYTIQKIYTQD